MIRRLIRGSLAIPLMMCCSIASQISIRQFVQWRESVPLLIRGAAGVPICRAPNFRHLSWSYAIYMLTTPGFGVVRRAASPVIRTMVGFAGGVVGGLTAMPGSLPIIWCDLRGVPKEHQRGYT